MVNAAVPTELELKVIAFMLTLTRVKLQLPLGAFLFVAHEACAVPDKSVVAVTVHCTLPSGRLKDRLTEAPLTPLPVELTTTARAMIVLPAENVVVGTNEPVLLSEPVASDFTRSVGRSVGDGTFGLIRNWLLAVFQ